MEEFIEAIISNPQLVESEVEGPSADRESIDVGR